MVPQLLDRLRCRDIVGHSCSPSFQKLTPGERPSHRWQWTSRSTCKNHVADAEQLQPQVEIGIAEPTGAPVLRQWSNSFTASAIRQRASKTPRTACQLSRSGVQISPPSVRSGVYGLPSNRAE